MACTEDGTSQKLFIHYRNITQYSYLNIFSTNVVILFIRNERKLYKNTFPTCIFPYVIYLNIPK